MFIYDSNNTYLTLNDDWVSVKIKLSTQFLTQINLVYWYGNLQKDSDILLVLGLEYMTCLCQREVSGNVIYWK